MLRSGYSCVDAASGLGVPNEAVTSGPTVEWRHIDGPLMFWAGHIHWLTFKERLRIWLRLTTVDGVASARWPHLSALRAALKEPTHDEG